VIHLGLPAYVGPGAGFAFLGSLLSLVSAVVAGVASVLLWPFRMVWALVRRPHGTRSRRAIFLGFEGLDPSMTERMMAEGKLPHLSRLREHGSYQRLRTTFPALSSVAWSTFATGVNPGKHGVFDSTPAAQRKIESFWKILGRHAVRSTILWVPGATIPEAFNGRELAAGPQAMSYPRYYATYLTKLFGTGSQFSRKEREAILFDALDKTRLGVVACVFEAHTVEALYRDVDRIVGELQAFADDNTALFVLSDHGCCAFRRGVNLNAWLLREGYLALETDGEAIDWTRTRAHARGASGVYLNLRGREAEGLRRELAARLTGLRDDVTGETAIQSACQASDLYHGPYLNAAPDIVIGYAPGYGPSSKCVAGGVSPMVFDDDCTGASHGPGVLFSNLKINADSPGIEDMAPTALSLFGVPAPPWMEGRPVVSAA
jgi:predicted AlkP superfamily phosphohydrolase/phosphomutase